MLSGLERPSSGAVRFGLQGSRDNESSTGNIAFAFQEAVFLRGTLRSNLHLALRLHHVDGDARESRIADAADASGIGHLLDRNAHQLSGGEARRANLARVLALRAPVTLLDEPLAGLDGPARRQLLHELPALLAAFATTTILVTHDREEALHLADDVVVLLDGRVRAQGAKGDVFRNPPNPETARFLGFTVLSKDDRIIAAPPAALRPRAGEVEFPFDFERLADLGTHREVVGRVGDALVTAQVEGDDNGPWTVVSADKASLIHFGNISAGMKL